MIRATTKRVWEMLDYSKPRNEDKTELQPGTYELERISNPHGFEGNWLVVKGTTIGMSEGAWKQWINGVLADREGHPNFGKPINWGDAEIVLEENGQLIPPPTD